VFKNRVLRIISGPKRDEVTGEWRKLHNEEINDLHSSPNIVHVITSRKMRLAGHVQCMGDRRSVYGVFVGRHDGNRPLGRKCIDGRIILRWIFRKWDVVAWTGLIWLRTGTGGRHL
jgi:hypothetical protein